MWLSHSLACFLIAFLSSSHAYQHGRNPHKIVKRQTVTCSSTARFRTADGQCNNLITASLGSAGTTLQRLIPAVYADGVSTPRTTGVNGEALPSAREVSVKCHPPDNVRADVTLMVMQWGQFIDHDLTLTPHASVPEGTDCCTSSHSECFPIPLVNDEFFKTRTCMDFTRSHRETPSGATVQEQTNSLTAFIDASNVYGSSDEEMTNLRGDNGELKDTVIHNKGKYLPAGSTDSCRAGTGEYCFLAGDERVNEQPALGTMHTIWMREHNRIAQQLRQRHSDWNNNRIFQETRKIVGAMLQAITYNEFLPVVLGPLYHSSYALDSSVYQYNPSINPSIINSFATAAYRFGHSLIPEDITVDGQLLQFKNLFLSPTEVLKDMDKLSRSLYREKGMKVDRHFAHSVTRHLFQSTDGDGFDLVSLNIQRGRDHGLPSYTSFRQLCASDQPPINQLQQLFPNDAVAQSAYSHVNDTDLFTGGMSEPAVPGGLVGPTFACIMGVQFNFLKLGDRFFYLNKQGNQAFTDAQINELNKVRLSRVICDNTENDRMQENIFLPESNANPRKDCSQIPRLNLDAWGSSGGGGGGGGGRDGGGRDGRHRG